MKIHPKPLRFQHRPPKPEAPPRGTWFYHVSFMAQGPRGITFHEIEELACAAPIVCGAQVNQLRADLAGHFKPVDRSGAAVIGDQVRVVILNWQLLRFIPEGQPDFVTTTQAPETAAATEEAPVGGPSGPVAVPEAPMEHTER